MSSILSLENTYVNIYRNSDVVASDVGDPSVTRTEIYMNIPCRYDSGTTSRSYPNKYQGEMRDIEISGRVYIDASHIPDPSDIQEKDLIELPEREEVLYQVFRINRAYDFQYLHHIEIELVAYENK